MERGVDDFEGIFSADEFGINRQSGEAGHVGLVDLDAHRNHPAALGLGNRREIFALDGVDLFNDRRGVGLGDLAAVLEVNFVAVVFGRVVAGGEVDARLGLHMAHGKGQLGRGARTLEKIGVAAEVGDDFGGEFGEFAGEKPCVVAEADGGFAGAALLGEILLHMMHEPLSGAADVVGIHCVRAHAGELGTAEWLGRTLLGFRDDGADRFAPQAAGAEGEGAEKAVVQLRPVPGGGEFLDRGAVDRRGAFGEKAVDVFGGLGEEFSVRDGLLNRGIEGAHAVWNTTPRAKLSMRGLIRVPARVGTFGFLGHPPTLRLALPRGSAMI